MHSNSLELFRRFALPYYQTGMRVLEVGPDPAWLCRRLVQSRGAEYWFADLKNDSGGAANFVPMLDEYAFDCAGSAFDIVSSANVLEHVRKPWKWLQEAARVTRPNGLIVCVNPVSWPYHPAPVDCWRLFPEAYRALFEEAGLQEVLSWHGNVVPIDAGWAREHGPQTVTDTISIARKPGAADPSSSCGVTA